MEVSIHPCLVAHLLAHDKLHKLNTYDNAVRSKIKYLRQLLSLKSNMYLHEK
jgi:hypothetical protein